MTMFNSNIAPVKHNHGPWHKKSSYTVKHNPNNCWTNIILILITRPVQNNFLSKLPISLDSSCNDFVHKRPWFKTSNILSCGSFILYAISRGYFIIALHFYEQSFIRIFLWVLLYTHFFQFHPPYFISTCNNFLSQSWVTCSKQLQRQDKEK